jgi:flagellar motor protein MotB
VGKGEANPVGDNNTEKGRFENRRVEVLILSE